MGGNDGLRTDSTYYRGYTTSDYLTDLATWYTRSLRWNPGHIWPARNYTQAANSWIHQAAQPYGFYSNYAGRPSYVVLDQYELSETVAWRMHGYKVDMQPNPEEVLNSIADNSLIAALPNDFKKSLQNLLSIGAWKDHEALEDHPDLKQEAKELEARAKVLEKKLELILKNEAGLSSSEVLASLRELEQDIKELDVEAKDLYERCKELETEYNAKKAEEEQERIEREAEEEGDVSDESSVATKEGDKEMDTDELAEEYDVKKPIIDSEQDVSSIVTEMKRNTNNSDDAKNYKDFMAMFTTGKVNSKNIVEVLDGVLSTDYDLYKGIYEMNNSNEAMSKVIETLRARVNELKSNGYLDANTAKTLKDKLTAISNKLGNGEDIPRSNPQIDGKNVNEVLKDIIAQLKGKGTQTDFDAKIKAKQDERITKATADFYKDHATTRTGKEVNGTPALPAGVEYLPNSKEFQWKYDSTTVFKGKSYRALNDKILESKKTEVIAKWNEILKSMDTNLKDKAAS